MPVHSKTAFGIPYPCSDVDEDMDGLAWRCYPWINSRDVSQQKGTVMTKTKLDSQRYVSFTSSNNDYIQSLLQYPYAIADFITCLAVPETSSPTLEHTFTCLLVQHIV